MCLKNGHALSDVEAAETMHYRVMLINGVFEVPVDITFDLIADHLQSQSRQHKDKFDEAAKYVRAHLESERKERHDEAVPSKQQLSRK